MKAQNATDAMHARMVAAFVRRNPGLTRLEISKHPDGKRWNEKSLNRYLNIAVTLGLIVAKKAAPAHRATPFRYYPKEESDEQVKE